MTEAPFVLESRALTIGHSRRRIVAEALDFAMAPGEILCLLGPNGSGKTTLFRTLLGLLSPLAGEVLLQGKPIPSWPRNAFARRVAYVPQAHAGLFPYSVEDIVLMGRAAHMGRFSTPSGIDRAQAYACLATLGINHLRHRAYTALSGGERQLVIIARALAQQPAVLLMDEPASSLDFGNQIRILEHISRLRGQGISILLSTHQPEHALRVADRVVLLGAGRFAGIGTPSEMLTVAKLAALYGISEPAVAAFPGFFSTVSGACP